MPLVMVTTDIEVYCGNCGAGMCGQSKGGDNHVTVDPCHKCLDEADTTGWQRGYDEGLEENEAEAVT